MGLASVQATKEKYVAEILENSVYMPDSGLYQRLKERLLKMAKDDLSSLALVIRLKVDDAKSLVK